MSETEQFYNAVAIKFGVCRNFKDLHPQEQMLFCQAINMILSVMHD